MAKGSGRINPDSTAGNARLGTGRGSNAGRSQPIPKGSLPTPKKFGPPAGMNAYNSTTSTNYTIPVGLGLIGGAAVVGSRALKERLKRDAIKKASVKTRKGQSRGR